MMLLPMYQLWCKIKSNLISVNTHEAFFLDWLHSSVCCTYLTAQMSLLRVYCTGESVCYDRKSNNFSIPAGGGRRTTASGRRWGKLKVADMLGNTLSFFLAECKIWWESQYHSNISVWDNSQQLLSFKFNLKTGNLWEFAGLPLSQSQHR